MRHEMLTQHAPFCIGAMAKKGTLSQHFVTHVVPPLIDRSQLVYVCNVTHGNDRQNGNDHH